MADYEATKIEKLIKDYVIHQKDYAELEISQRKVKGENLIPVLNYLRNKFDKDIRE